MTPLADARVAIVGLGLMGGSLAGALHGRCTRIIGVARREETIEQALSQGLIDDGTTDLAAGVNRANIVILATPVRAIIAQLEQIGPLLSPGCLLMDVGSTKAQVVARMERLPAGVQPLGGHPMCGREVAGIAAVDSALYQGKTFILTPLNRTSAEALALGKELVKAVGAQPLVLEPARHDYLVGTLSHLPYLLACALVSTADATTSADSAAWEIVATGFRDTSRVAASDVTMMTDILLTNRGEILKALRTYRSHLERLDRLVEEGSEDKIRDTLSYICEKRKEMFP